MFLIWSEEDAKSLPPPPSWLEGRRLSPELTVMKTEWGVQSFCLRGTRIIRGRRNSTQGLKEEILKDIPCTYLQCGEFEIFNFKGLSTAKTKYFLPPLKEFNATNLTAIPFRSNLQNPSLSELLKRSQASLSASRVRVRFRSSLELGFFANCIWTVISMAVRLVAFNFFEQGFIFAMHMG